MGLPALPFSQATLHAWEELPINICTAISLSSFGFLCKTLFSYQKMRQGWAAVAPRQLLILMSRTDSRLPCPPPGSVCTMRTCSLRHRPLASENVCRLEACLLNEVSVTKPFLPPPSIFFPSPFPSLFLFCYLCPINGGVYTSLVPKRVFDCAPLSSI